MQRKYKILFLIFISVFNNLQVDPTKTDAVAAEPGKVNISSFSPLETLLSFGSLDVLNVKKNIY